ncbi:MAG: hypothetical protein HY840_02780 [Bacteroidetes bacterium]|nr:hypothetical protein [Bacteroidota bacterium]
MEALKHRKIKSGAQYEHLFPSANLKDETVKKGASVYDTVKFIPKVVRETLPQTEGISKMLRGNTLSETCKNIWDFVYHHINYNKDEDGTEQIRSPARTWHDRSRGVDCDCYTVFISSILSNLKIPHTLRIAKYRKDYFQHIYPIVHKTNGKYITIDCVVDYFNYEEPYTEIKDKTMDLQYLSGIENSESEFGNSEDESLGKKKGKGKLKDLLKKGLHIANRANPATLLLRNGLLASMKLNIMKVGQRLKYAYMSDEQAKQKGVDTAKFQHLKTIKDKLEKIFYGAGGKPENLKKAILTGKGNKKGKHDVDGLGDFEYDTNLGDMNEATPLPQLLGDEMYRSENAETLGALGEPVTAASITAATGAIASIAALLKKIGNIFPKNDKEDESAKDFQTTDKDTDPNNVQKEIEQNKDEIVKMDASTKKVDTSTDDSSGSGDDSTKQGFWDKNKKWIKPTAIGVTGLGLLYLGYRAITGHKEENHPKQLSGTKNKKHPKKEPVALM